MTQNLQLFDELRPEEYQAWLDSKSVDELLDLLKADSSPEDYERVLVELLRQPTRRGSPEKDRTEESTRKKLATYLRLCGHEANEEVALSCGGRCDILIGSPAGPKAIIEIKISDPIRAIGQLFGYSASFINQPELILATTVVDDFLKAACRIANITVWALTDGENAWNFKI